MEDLSVIQKIAIWALPVLLAITLHEVAHGWVAYRLGDPTAKQQGRLSLNPIKHIDPVGTLLVPGLLLLLGGIIFGWAKPVPVNFGRLGSPRRDTALVAAAGPLANLLMVLGWVLVIKLAQATGSEFLAYAGMAGVSINLVLMALNLLPILPLDGGRVLHSLLPPSWAEQYAKLEPFGLIILLLLIFTQLLGKLLNPVLKLAWGLIAPLI